MYFLIDPIRNADPYRNFAAQAADAYAGGSPMAIVNVTSAPAGSDVVVGAKMLVRENGATQGELGDAVLEAMTVAKARELMAMGKNDYLRLEDGVECYIEAYTTPPTLVLIGGGHVSKAIAPIAKSVGFRIFVFDDREQFANPERFPEADITMVGDYREGFDRLPVNANSFVVVASRGHQFDDAAVSGALRTPASYVGLLGSKRKTILIYEELIRNGFDPEELRRINAPIGLDIGGRTPEEIALSVMSEIVAFRLGGNGGSMKLQERLLDKAIERASKSKTADHVMAAGG